MLARRLGSFFRRSPTSELSSSSKAADEGKKGSFGRKAVSFVLLTVTGGVALSALDDIVIYRGCSSKAMEKGSKNQAIKDAIGEPIVKGPWYNASLAVAHQRHSVSCTFPVSGPRGNGVFQLKAVRNGEWDILLMEALVYVPTNEEKQQTMRITVSDNSTAPACTPCTECPSRNLRSQKPNDTSRVYREVSWNK